MANNLSYLSPTNTRHYYLTRHKRGYFGLNHGSKSTSSAVFTFVSVSVFLDQKLRDVEIDMDYTERCREW